MEINTKQTDTDKVVKALEEYIQKYFVDVKEPIAQLDVHLRKFILSLERATLKSQTVLLNTMDVRNKILKDVENQVNVQKQNFNKRLMELDSLEKDLFPDANSTVQKNDFKQ